MLVIDFLLCTFPCSFRSIVKRGWKLTLKSLWDGMEASSVLFPHLTQGSSSKGKILAKGGEYISRKKNCHSFIKLCSGKRTWSLRSCMHVIWTLSFYQVYLSICSSGMNTLCWFALVVSLFALNPLELVGVQEPLTRLFGWWDDSWHTPLWLRQ